MSVCAPGPPLVAAIAAVEDVYGRDGVGVLEVVEKGARSLSLRRSCGHGSSAERVGVGVGGGV